MKSERLKKLELELHDLEQWKNLGLVPKKDLEKHQGEIDFLKKRVEEEKERLQVLKSSGDQDEYSAPKRNAQQRVAYQEPHTLPDENVDESSDITDDADLDNEIPTSYETGSGTIVEDDEAATTITEEEDEDPFSDKNRWRRGILEDPDADSW